MSIYDDQLRARIKNDKVAFDESFFALASVVTGDTRSAAAFLSDRFKAQSAVEEVLKYYNITPEHVPDEIETVDGQLEYLLRPSGIMRRRVELKSSWYKDSYGPILGATKDGDVIALIPHKFAGYTYFDRSTGKDIKVTRKEAAKIDIDAFCFYKPLPNRKLCIMDLLKYIASALAVSDIVMIAAATLAIVLLGMITPYATQQLFTNVITSGRMLQLMSIAVLLLGAAVSIFLINITSSILTARISAKIDITVQAAVMARVLTLPASVFKDYSAGDLAQRISNLNSICGTVVGISLKTLLSSIFSLLYIGQISVLAPSLAIPAFFVILTGFAVSVAGALAASKVTHMEMKEKSKLSGLVFSLFSGIQKIRLAGCEQRAFSKWAAAYVKMARRRFTPNMFVRVSPVISMGVMAAGSVLLFYTAGVNNVPVADYMAFSASFGMAVTAMLMLTLITQMVSSLNPSLKMIKPVLETEPEISDGKKVITNLSGAIEINNVSFRYNEDMPSVLEDISLKVRPGQYLAIVGQSGCGKSTLLRILLGFESPDKGAVYYDGRDISKIDLKSLRQKIGCVIQNGKLMSGEIFHNITVSAPTLTLDKAWEAAEMAGIADDIRAMPMGMHTFIAESGGGLSGGQKQRLMIARAIASKPNILMLDEATSALDNITQKHVAQSLSGLKCTRIVIAHRLSTIKQCNRIVFLEKGRIIEDGTYDELIALDGKFAELAKRQMLDQDGFVV